ncbi:hypothetical protein F7725_003713 [Dissostichus mawsoni]|uniref:Uncharacterized protein n=1 Tax=Dissostichus mawsoni TaxID=36200 RepID=A0A7J5YB42_DISMA|nr:hypothetical protein F7725_003713 [Dissostichus mawsoni]
MMKGMSLFSDVSTQRRVFGWVSIIWFTAGIAVSHGLELQTVSQVAAQCGENVTLTCNNKSLCQYDSQHDDPKVKCDYIDEPLPQILTLTLLNVMPTDQGKYLCKLRSIYGVMSNTTVLKYSKLDVQKGNLNQPYTCSLWMPSTSKALFSHKLHVVKKLKGSSESMVTLQWICLIMEIIMVKCMT